MLPYDAANGEKMVWVNTFAWSAQVSASYILEDNPREIAPAADCLNPTLGSQSVWYKAKEEDTDWSGRLG
jgi:hypothetical protein